MAVDVAGAVACGRGEALEVHELGEAAGEGFAGRCGVYEGAGEGVLGGDPGGELGGIEVFHPAVGVGDGVTEVVVDVRGSAGGGVGQGRCGHREWFFDCLRGGRGLPEARMWGLWSAVARCIPRLWYSHRGYLSGSMVERSSHFCETAHNHSRGVP